MAKKVMGKIEKLEGDRGCLLIAGLSGSRVKEAKAFLQRLSKHGAVVQAFNCDAIAGRDHLLLIAQQSVEAFKRKMGYAKKQDIDLLLRVAGTLQIEEALAKVGIKEGYERIALLALGEEAELKAILREVEGEWRLDDEVLEPDKARRDRLLRELGLMEGEPADLELQLPLLMAERAALLVCERQANS